VKIDSRSNFNSIPPNIQTQIPKLYLKEFSIRLHGNEFHIAEILGNFCRFNANDINISIGTGLLCINKIRLPKFLIENCDDLETK